MIREDLELCTLSEFIELCTDGHYQKYENGKLVTKERAHKFQDVKEVNGEWKVTPYEIMDIKLSGETLTFQLKSKDGVVYKSFSIYDVGWAYDTSGVRTFYYKTETGKKSKWYII